MKKNQDLWIIRLTRGRCSNETLTDGIFFVDDDDEE